MPSPLAVVAEGRFPADNPDRVRLGDAKTLNFPLSGNSSTNIFNKPFSCCHVVIGDPLDIDTDTHRAHHARHEDARSNAATHNDLRSPTRTFAEGSNLDSTNTFKRDSQLLGVDYTLSGDLNVFGFDLTYNKTEGDTIRTAACCWSLRGQLLGQQEHHVVLVHPILTSAWPTCRSSLMRTSPRRPPSRGTGSPRIAR